MKYLIYELFSGVGFCNQLFSLETAIYLANISNRKLILLIRNPLCHCGRASWDYGKFLDFFSDAYLKFLPNGLDVYYRIIPNNIKDNINSDDCSRLQINTKFSSCIFIDSEFSNNSNIDSFANGREKIIYDFDKIDSKYYYINKSNASRCFYNFYTNKNRYLLMSKICYSLTILSNSITSNYIKKSFDLAIHLRLGDYFKKIDLVNKNSLIYTNNLLKTIESLDNINTIVIMCDRKDGDIINILKSKYDITFSDELIKTTGNPVQDFLLEKYICQNSKYFIGTQGSTVSNYINYINYLDNKNYNLYNKKTCLKSYNNNKYSWNLNNIYNHPISWSIFWPDNIIKKKYLTNKKNYYSYGNSFIKIIDEININSQKNKKIISYCLYGLNNERNRKRDFDKGVYVNYYYMKNHNYKDWTMRVYMPYNEPIDIINNIKKFGDIELILVDTNICLRALRFLPNDDPNVKVWLSRDLDSIINNREEKAVKDWLDNKNDKELMIMSDNRQHTWTVSAGMFGKINSETKDTIVENILHWSHHNNPNKYDGDAIIAEKYFYQKNNYIQYYRAGKKLINNVPFPDLSSIHCRFVGNISPITKYYTDLKLEKHYPFLSNKSDINNNDNFLYTPWRCHFKNSEPLCSLIWKGDDFIMTVDPKRETGTGTWKTLNGDGKKLLRLNTHIQILWEDKIYREAYMPNEEIISIKHGERWYNFIKVINNKKLKLQKSFEKNVSFKKKDDDIKCFSNLWKGGFKSGYNKCQNQNLLENYIKTNMKGKCCLEIGCGGGQWSKFIYNLNIFDKIFCIDALSEEHNNFWNYVGHEKKDKIIYIQVWDFSLSFIPKNSLDYVFSYDVFCHISYSGQKLYLKNLYDKCKNNCELLIMYADVDKYHSNNPNRFKCFELEQKQKGKIFKNYDELRQILLDDCDNNSPNWCFIGTERFLNLCKKYDYNIIDIDIKIDTTSPITRFKKYETTKITSSIENIERIIKNIVIYSNCQGNGISFFLKKIFPNSTINIINNYDIIWKKKKIDVTALQQADLFIFQPISETHGIYSTVPNTKNNIMSYLKTDCKTISFPYIYNDSLWVIIPPAKIDNYIGNYNKMNKYVNTLPIEKLKSEGKTLDEVINLYNTNKINFNYKERYDNSIRILKMKEDMCDVIVSDYIEKNIMKEKLFFTQNHPTTNIFIHCVNQILSLLKINFTFKSKDFNNNVIKLPGNWIHTQYDVNYWNFNFDVKSEQYFGNHYYINHIKKIYNISENIYNLSFSIPSECIKSLDISLKTKEFATIIPGKFSTYIFKPFNKENCIKYNKDYEISKYAFTYKKGGWDCLRHYEILANNCIPLFLDINKCPQHTMYNFPKKILNDILEDYTNKRLDDVKYEYYLKQLHNYTKKYLTCEKQAENVIKILNNHKKTIKPKILLLHGKGLNYSLATLCIGLRKLLSSNFVDYPKYSYIYNTSNKYNISILEDNNNIDRSDIKNKINNKYFDFIIIGSVGPDEGNSNKIFDNYEGFNKYNNDEIVFLFGGDRPFNMKVDNNTSNYLKNLSSKGICFVRELNYTSSEYYDESWISYANKMQVQWNKKIELIKNFYTSNINI